MKWKGLGKEMYYPGIWPEGLRKTTKIWGTTPIRSAWKCNEII